jgi:hypothetical protein
MNPLAVGKAVQAGVVAVLGQAVKLPVENVEKSSPTLSASFFHWPLIDRQDLSGSFIGRRRMTNRGLMQKSMPVLYG